MMFSFFRWRVSFTNKYRKWSNDFRKKIAINELTDLGYLVREELPNDVIIYYRKDPKFPQTMRDL